MARKGGRKGTVRSSSPRMAERITKNARYLRDHPELAAPRCKGSCPFFCTFKRARKRVAKMHKNREDPEKLKKMGKRFHDIGKAYSAILRIAYKGKDALEYMQNVNTPKGKVPILPWSKAPAPCHVGLQHHHDPSLRLLLAVPFVSEGEAVWATEDELVCAHDGRPPEEALEALLDQLGLKSTGPDEAVPKGATGREQGQAYIELDWDQAGITMELAPPPSGRNSMMTILSRMVTPDVLKLVTPVVHVPPLEDPQGGLDAWERVALPEPVVRSYATGELDDRGLIEEAYKALRAELSVGTEAMVVYDHRVHRPPFDDLVARLDPDPPLDEVLSTALDHLERPVILEKGTASELLHRLWDEHAETALVDLLGDRGRELYDPRASMDDIERLSARLARERSRQRVARELPTYEDLPTPVDLADRVARAYVSGGKEEARQHLSSAPARTHQAMALALVNAVGLSSPSWTIEPRERDMAELLEPYAAELLEARGEAYHEALETLLKATGSTDELHRVD